MRLSPPTRPSSPPVAARLASLALAVFVLGGCAAPAMRAPRPADSAPKASRALGGADCARTSGYDVVIVGAGLAGLTAGRELTHLGRSVLVLEAEDRIGGRGFVGEIPLGPGRPPVAIDYGGAWIHGVATNPLTGVVDAMGFERVRSVLDAPFYLHGRQATAEEQARYDEIYEAYEAALDAAAHRIEHERELAAEACAVGEELAAGEATAEEVCERLAAEIRTTSDVAAAYVPDEPRYAAVAPLLVASAGPLETAAELAASSAYDAAGFAAGEDDLVAGGIGTFVQELGRGVPVCLGTPVEAVAYDETGVTLTAGGRRYEAAAALVTVSVGVLQAGIIDFVPPLPDWKRDAIAALDMGHMQKVILPFRDDIFDDVAPNTWVLAVSRVTAAERALAARAGAELAADAERVMAFVLEPLGAPIAIGFYGGDRARLFESACAGIESTSGPRSASGCDDPAIDTAVATLGEIYGASTVAGALLADSVHVTRWSLEPHTLGAYSVPTPGAWDQREVLGRPIGAGGADDATPRVFFAGEAASRPIFNGSYPGAWETGLAAARDIHAVLLEVAAE